MLRGGSPKHSRLALTDPAYLRGIAVLEQLLVSVDPKRNHPTTQLPQPIQSGDVDTVSSRRTPPMFKSPFMIQMA